MATAVAAVAAVPPQVVGTNDGGGSSATTKQIPIVCPGHTRPLAELQFYQTPAPGRSSLFQCFTMTLVLFDDAVVLH